MKMFNKNRKSFGNNNNRGHDRNSSYRNNKFSRKNGGRNKGVMKSEQFHEKEDATPWHVMKQNLKPLIAITNPEIEDDWNTEEKQKSKLARQEFMRQKDERHRKFVIENERKTVSKWDSFSDDENKQTKNVRMQGEDKQLTKGENDSAESKIKNIKKKTKKVALDENEDDPPLKKVKKSKVTLPNETFTENENDESMIINTKSKKTKKVVEQLLETVIESISEQAVVSKKKSKKTVTHVEPLQERDIEVPSIAEKKSKKKSKKTVIHVEPLQERDIEVPSIAEKKSKKKSKRQSIEGAISEEAIEQPVPDNTTTLEKEKEVANIEEPEETFLESLATQKLKEPLLFQNTEYSKSGPKCFACRQYGHSLKQCRDFDNASTRICIKCGSTEHAYQNCTVHKGRVFKFASCFICKQTGHISSQCKEKKNGVYPDGGNCRYCSSIEHLGFNCPKRPGRNKKRKFSKNRNAKPNDKLRKVQGGRGGHSGGSGRIQKDNRIKKNFK